MYYFTYIQVITKYSSIALGCAKEIFKNFEEINNIILY